MQECLVNFFPEHSLFMEVFFGAVLLFFVADGLGGGEGGFSWSLVSGDM